MFEPLAETVVFVRLDLSSGQPFVEDVATGPCQCSSPSRVSVRDVGDCPDNCDDERNCEDDPEHHEAPVRAAHVISVTSPRSCLLRSIRASANTRSSDVEDPQSFA